MPETTLEIGVTGQTAAQGFKLGHLILAQEPEGLVVLSEIRPMSVSLA
jgi:hypothetical protein